MKRIAKYLLIALGVFVLLIIAGYIYLLLPPNDGRTPAERRQIADACFAMLHSSLTNEDTIKPDDPRIPKVIRDLHPIGIIIDPNSDVQIDFTKKPGEYFIMRLPGHTNTWILCAAGVGIPFGPREVLRMEHD
ncbi:MAG: hypothetical protein KGJ60_14340 [Verrucomicrobiota bacterium]|nr:hypothetical protein [Verrucomicrobiota bacterium]